MNSKFVEYSLWETSFFKREVFYILNEKFVTAYRKEECVYTREVFGDINEGM